MYKCLSIAACLLLLALRSNQAAETDEDPTGVPLGLVTASLLEAKITEAEADLTLDTEARGIRAATIRNWDRKELLVPNKEFITGRLLNWSLSDHVTRLMIPVGVAYGTDVEQAHALMREAAEEHPRVLDDPKPIPSFQEFGDNALMLVLRAYVDNIDYRLGTITDLHKAINSKFQQAGIAIAFPQRDLHLDTHQPLRVSIETAQP